MPTSLPRGTDRPNDPAYQPEFVRGEGCYLWDSNGKQYLDFVSGYSSLSFGHSHPRLVEVAKSQLNTLVHLVGWRHPWREQLADRLAAVAPLRGPVRVWISTTGARAIEIAWKIAYNKRPGLIVSFDYGYHGRSIATSQITRTNKLDIQLPQTIESSDTPNRPQTPLPVLAYPTCEDCPLGLHRSSCSAECFDASEAWLRTHQQFISAVIVEPALGARGYYFAADAFFKRLRNVTRDLGIVLIDDEVQMGLGRLGALFASSEQGWEPDLIVLGKSLGGGLLAVSAVLGSAALMDSLPQGIESETFAADPLGCRVAMEALTLFEDEIEPRLSVLSKALNDGVHKLLLELTDRFPLHHLLADSQGCSAVIQILPESSHREPSPTEPMALATGDAQENAISDRTNFNASGYDSRETSATLARAWTERALQAGLLVHWSGKHSDRIVLIPPLIASEDEIKRAFTILASTYDADG